MNKIRLITLFSGYDSQALSMERLKRDYPDKFDYELVAWCEIDKAACMAHDAIFPQWKDRNLGDISKVKAEDIPDCDCMTWSFPCTDISGAGKQMGLSKDSGTRSSLCWEAIRCFKAKRPKYLLMENVASLAQKKFIKDFHALQYELEKMGYTNFCAILDSSKYGVPQHRERLFMISTLDCTKSYHFPDPFKLEKRIKDILEPYGTVDESFYFSAKQLASMFDYCDKKKSEGCGFQTQFTDGSGIASCVTTRYGASYTDAYLKEPALQQRLSIYADNAQAGRVYDVDGISPAVKCYTGGNSEPKILEPVAVAMRGRNPDNPSDRSKGCPTEQRLEFGDNVANCITTVQKDSMVAEPQPLSLANLPDKTVLKDEDGRGYLWQGGSLWRVRKLTPIEVFRLQDVSNEDAKKIIAVCSKTACYQLAGNSITISPLYHIFRKLWIDTENESAQKSLFDF